MNPLIMVIEIQQTSASVCMVIVNLIYIKCHNINNEIVKLNIYNHFKGQLKNVIPFIIINL